MNARRPGLSDGHSALSAGSTPAELEHRSRDLRTDIDMTLSEIAARLAPDHLRHVAAARIRRSSLGLTLRAIRTIQHRPKVAAAAGIAALAAAGALIRYWRNSKRR